MIFLSNITESFRFQSSQVGVDHYEVTVSFTVPLGTSIIAEALVPVLDGGYYYVMGLKELVKAHMEQNNYSFYSLNFHARPYDADGEWMENLDDISISEEVLYNSLKFRGSAYTIVNWRFMTRRTSMVIADNANYILHWANGTPGDTFDIVYHLKDGSTDTQTVQVTGAAGSVALGRTALKDAYYAYAKYNARTMTVYFQEQSEYLIFNFRNMFNVEERMTLPASIEENPSTEHESAVYNQITQHYDIEHRLELKVKTAPLTDGQLDMLLELCRSRKVRMYRNMKEGWVSVLVDDYKMPKSDNPNSPRVAELTLVPEDYDDVTAMS